MFHYMIQRMEFGWYKILILQVSLSVFLPSLLAPQRSSQFLQSMDESLQP